MVELCVEESRSSLLSAFVRCHDGIVHGEAAALERVLRSGGGIDGAPEHGVGHAESGFGKAADHFGSLACGPSFIDRDLILLAKRRKAMGQAGSRGDITLEQQPSQQGMAVEVVIRSTSKLMFVTQVLRLGSSVWKSPVHERHSWSQQCSSGQQVA